MMLYLESDGKRIPIELDKPFGLEALSGKKTATLRAEPYRVFQYAGLSFRYPRGFSFEANLENRGVSLWTLDGNDVVIMVHQYAGTRDHAALCRLVIKQITEQYADAKYRELETKLKLNGAPLNGRRIEVTLANTLVHQDVFSFPSGETSVVLILQDTPDANSKSSVERITAERMLRESLRLPAK